MDSPSSHFRLALESDVKINTQIHRLLLKMEEKFIFTVNDVRSLGTLQSKTVYSQRCVAAIETLFSRS